MGECRDKIILHPIVSTLQRMAVYDLKDKLLIVGSNNAETVFRMLRIDRMVPKHLSIIDDGKEYTKEEVQTVLMKASGKSGRSLMKKISAFGIVGFVQFMEGYYLILVTKRRRVATIGLHYIYKIEDTEIIYITNESVRVSHHDEARYYKMFQSIDLSSNFYFSYSYDITHTLQVNMSVPKVLKDQNTGPENSSFMNQKGDRIRYFEYEIRGHPNKKFVWNEHLLSLVESKLHSDWILHIMHGFISQSIVSIFGRSVFVALIARRSNKYAGTRFLKRGANFEGDVANEVETEQIVEDMGISSWPICPRLSSFVQMRGSIPGHWSQDITTIVSKPTIMYDLTDPFAETPGKHFKQLFERYGSPIIVLNLVKQREKKKHESTLSEQYSSDIKYLNQFLPPQHEIQYVPFDMARKNKGSKANVLGRLAKIAENAISKTGMYIHNSSGETFQTGIIRVNCVDCLDRTNTAQFALGKYALARQLQSLGLLGREEELDFDCDCTRLLEVLYEDHGDTLALQYGGSQLVHRIKTYRKTAPWTSQGNDIMQTMSRYLSNKFSDAEKQHAMNLFLGLFIPSKNDSPIWEQTTDYYLHNPSPLWSSMSKTDRLPLTQWWGEDEVEGLSKVCRDRDVFFFRKLTDHEKVDAYSDFHRVYEYTPFIDIFPIKMSHTLRDFAPQYVTDLSPFTVRRGPGRRHEESKDSRNPSLTGHFSTSSNTSSDSSFQESEEEEVKSEAKMPISPTKQSLPYSPDPPPPLVVIKHPSPQDTLLYKRYVIMGRKAISSKGYYTQWANILNPPSKFKFESSYEVSVPKVSPESMAFYESYVAKSYNTLDGCISTSQVESYARYRNNELNIYPAVPWEY